jgi:AcrR family transcriptional regulator
MLDRIIGDAAANGLGDRSLRQIAAATGTSHRMLHYHFGSRAGLVAAVVAEVEARQRALVVELAADSDGPIDPAELVRRMWAHLTRPEMHPFIRLFFETVGQPAFATRPLHSAPPPAGNEGIGSGHESDGASNGSRAGENLTTPWIAQTALTARRVDPDAARLAIAVVRGLLIDVVTSGDVDAPTRALERFLASSEFRRPSRRTPTRR